MSTNYNALLAHDIPVMSDTKRGDPSESKDGITHQLRTSIDIFPESMSYLLFTGALNYHSVHHILPSLPRSLHPAAAQKTAKLYPDKYRSINSMKELLALFVLRHEIFKTDVQMKDLPAIVRERGYFKFFKKVTMDIGSLVVMVAIVMVIPPIRLL